MSGSAPSRLECTACAARHDSGALANLCPCGGILYPRYDLGRDGCSFRRGDDAAADLLFITQEDRGYLKVGGKLQTVAAKQGSAELPAGARSTYVGLDNWVELVAQAGSGGVDAPDLSEWPSRMVIHDAQERVGFDARGMVRCKG